MTGSASFTKRAISLSLAATFLVLGLSACNTISGAGKDIKSTGGAIERTAEDSK